MKIHSICLVKDESDIIGDVIEEAIKWSDYIYIYDNGSTDGTTNILKELSASYPNIIFYKWSDRPFEDTIRCEVFQAFKSKAVKGEWWCRLDADEFYIDNPKTFLKQINGKYNTVYHTSFNYYFTEKDLKQYHKNPDDFSYKNLHFYKNNWSEIRFMRDNGNLYWPESSSWPVMNMKICPQKIRVKHYQYRNPQQIDKRVSNRKKAYEESGKFSHDQNSIGYLSKTDLLNIDQRIVNYRVLNNDLKHDDFIPEDHVPIWKPKNDYLTQFKIYLKNKLYRLNLLTYVYKLLER